MLQLTPVRGKLQQHPGQVVTSMIDLWCALNALYHMYYNYAGVLWNIQRRLQHIGNINFDTKMQCCVSLPASSSSLSPILQIEKPTVTCVMCGLPSEYVLLRFVGLCF